MVRRVDVDAGQLDHHLAQLLHSWGSYVYIYIYIHNMYICVYIYNNVIHIYIYIYNNVIYIYIYIYIIYSCIYVFIHITLYYSLWWRSALKPRYVRSSPCTGSPFLFFFAADVRRRKQYRKYYHNTIVTGSNHHLAQLLHSWGIIYCLHSYIIVYHSKYWL